MVILNYFQVKPIFLFIKRIMHLNYGRILEVYQRYNTKLNTINFKFKKSKVKKLLSIIY